MRYHTSIVYLVVPVFAILIAACGDEHEQMIALRQELANAQLQQQLLTEQNRELTNDTQQLKQELKQRDTMIAQLTTRNSTLELAGQRIMQKFEDLQLHYEDEQLAHQNAEQRAQTAEQLHTACQAAKHEQHDGQSDDRRRLQNARIIIARHESYLKSRHGYEEEEVEAIRYARHSSDAWQSAIARSNRVKVVTAEKKQVVADALEAQIAADICEDRQTQIAQELKQHKRENGTLWQVLQRVRRVERGGEPRIQAEMAAPQLAGGPAAASEPLEEATTTLCTELAKKKRALEQRVKELEEQNKELREHVGDTACRQLLFANEHNGAVSADQEPSTETDTHPALTKTTTQTTAEPQYDRDSNQWLLDATALRGVLRASTEREGQGDTNPRATEVPP